MGRRELQEWIEARQRESAARKQEQWLARVIERELARRLDALLAAHR